MILFYNYYFRFNSKQVFECFSFLLLCCKIMPIPKWNNVYDLWLGTKNK